MVCENDWECRFPEHIKKVLELLNGEEKKEYEQFLKRLMATRCNSDLVGKTFCCYGEIVNITCPISEISCCPRFPNCSIVRSRQTIFKADLLRLSIETCTSLGTGKCSKMMELDANIIFDGGSDITLARPVKEKFKGLTSKTKV